ncbi:ubiquitin-conjugating enzyme E2 Z-like isoform X2 [Coccinella septempunctata]|nr:ubiquitin-conjugating enzyme E2 Z-like isoform X2 [Coccinella septempunctata]
MASAESMHNWDPHNEKGPKEPPLLPSASIRIKKDLMSLYKDPPPGIFATASESDIRNVHALIIGPMDTPYEGGMFYFFLRCPYDFPIKPPKVRFLTTDAGKVRFNPNMYACGKVCLSIIGTWVGPGWTPAQQLSSLLISIQSLFNDKPITNEPGYEKMFRPDESAEYSEMITHETIRVAVIGMVENQCHLTIPPEFVPIIERTFLQYFDVYVETCTKKMYLDGRKYKDPLNKSSNVVFKYKKMLAKLHEIKEKLVKKHKSLKQPSSDGDGSDYKEDTDEERIDETNVHEFVDSPEDVEDEDMDSYLEEYSEESSDDS